VLYLALSGLESFGRVPQGVALGWYIKPFQGKKNSVTAYFRTTQSTWKLPLRFAPLLSEDGQPVSPWSAGNSVFDIGCSILVVELLKLVPYVASAVMLRIMRCTPIGGHS
jgi:hypothetical protein